MAAESTGNAGDSGDPTQTTRERGAKDEGPETTNEDSRSSAAAFQTSPDTPPPSSSPKPAPRGDTVADSDADQDPELPAEPTTVRKSLTWKEVMELKSDDAYFELEDELPIISSDKRV